MKKIIFMMIVVVVLTTVVHANEFVQQWRIGFIEGCVREQGSLPACTCTADALIKALPGTKIYDFSMRMLKGKMTDKDKAILLDAIMKCQSKQ